ncbi:helix-turn-helix transcriptional regulator [Bacillus sp. FSL W8-1122]
MDVYTRMGKKIRKLRLDKNLTQEELGEKIGGYANTYISQMESGKRKISIELLEKIAEVLSVDITYFFDESDEVKLPDGSKAVVIQPEDLGEVTPEEIMEFIEMAKRMKNRK